PAPTAAAEATAEDAAEDEGADVDAATAAAVPAPGSTAEPASVPRVPVLLRPDGLQRLVGVRLRLAQLVGGEVPVVQAGLLRLPQQALGLAQLGAGSGVDPAAVGVELTLDGG